MDAEALISRVAPWRRDGRYVLRRPFVHIDGHCWKKVLSDDFADERSEARFDATLCLYEDDTRLLDGFRPRESILLAGGGRYCHFGNAVYFSTTDGSNPNTNRRTYSIDHSLKLPEWRNFSRARAAQRWLRHPRGEELLALGGADIPPPLVANLGLTNKCNLRCEICGSQKFLDETGVRRRHMDVRTFDAVAETLFPVLSQVELNSQGDPLLHPQVERVLDAIERHRCEAKIQHNGTLLSDRNIDLLLRLYGTVMMSLDAVGPKFDEVRRGGVWAKAEPGLKRFLKERDPARLSVGVYPTMTKRTIGEALNIVEWCAEHGVDVLGFHRYVPIQGSFEEAPSEDAYREMQDMLRQWCLAHGDPLKVQFENEPLNGKLLRDRRSEYADIEKAVALMESGSFMFPTEAGAAGADPFAICAAPNEYVEIGLDGQVGACCRAQDVTLGHATSVERFASAWFGVNYQAIRSSLRRGVDEPFPLPNCAGCVAFFAPGESCGRKAVDYARRPEQDEPRLTLFDSEVIEIEVIQKEDGLCHIARFPVGLPDDLQLWEDDRRLGPARALHDEIRSEGHGAYAISATEVFFSSSDGTDARRNGRTYTLRRHPLGSTRFDLAKSDRLELEGLRQEQDRCYVVETERELSDALILWEDDRRLGPAGAEHDEIRRLGGGAYSIEPYTVYLSSSDGSDPRRNGRVYTLRRHPLGAARFDFATSGRFDLERLTPDDGASFVAEIPELPIENLLLFEDERRLGPSGATHDEIRSIGRGAHNIGAGAVYLSSSDGGDPRRNGRVYSLRRHPLGAARRDIAKSGRFEVERLNPDKGASYVAEIPDLPIGDLLLFEDERRLGPAKAAHDEIRSVGLGAHSIEPGVVYLSSSDGSDPRRNGRVYSLRLHPLGAARFDLAKFGRVELEKISGEEGLCFVVELPAGIPEGVELWEDETPLGPASSLHDDIRRQGGGRHHIGATAVYFSTSDGSDARRNGRVYSLRKAVT